MNAYLNWVVHLVKTGFIDWIDWDETRKEDRFKVVMITDWIEM